MAGSIRSDPPPTFLGRHADPSTKMLEAQFAVQVDVKLESALAADDADVTFE